MSETKPEMGVYLGDAVYAREEREYLVLYTHNGIHPTNSIFLEPEVVELLKEYLARRKP